MYSVVFNNRKRKKYIERLHVYFGYFSFFKEPNVHLKRRVASASNKLDISLEEILEQSATHLSLKSENVHEGSDVLTIKSESHFLHDVFLKMDIEGAEYEIAQDIAKHHERIRCIAGEFHDLDKRTKEFNECFELLTQHFYFLHVHGNNGAPYDDANDFPTCVEITLINKDVLGKDIFFLTADLPRAGLDVPNNPAVEDYRIRFE